MSASFLELPGELRDMIYKLCVFQEEPISLSTGFDGIKVLGPGLLRVNETLRREASSLFYARNCFDFSMISIKRIVSFFQTIGCKNAGYIQHICVDFPSFHYQNAGNVTLSDYSIYAIIQSSCMSISTLSASADSALGMEAKLSELDNPESISTVFKAVDTLFMASFSKLKSIIVRVYDVDDDPRDFIIEMENYGWISKPTKYM